MTHKTVLPRLPLLTELTTSEIMVGVLAFTDLKAFPEQAVYALFSFLEMNYPEVIDRYRVQLVGGRFRSEQIERLLSFMCAGHVIERPVMADPQICFRLPNRNGKEDFLDSRGSTSVATRWKLFAASPQNSSASSLNTTTQLVLK